MAQNPKSLANLKSYKKGETGNPGGKPIGARNELSADFLKMLVRDFKENGAAAIEVLRAEKPDVYIKIIAELLPKQEEKTVDVNLNGVVEHRSISEISERITEMLGSRTESDSAISLPH